MRKKIADAYLQLRSALTQDFEEISRDLLQAEWNVTLEAFKEGRDNGIDLRYAKYPGNTVIVQCKHYAKSGFAALLRHLIDSELPKITQLNPGLHPLQ